MTYLSSYIFYQFNEIRSNNSPIVDKVHLKGYNTELMEYEKAREPSALEIARAIDLRQLTQGHRYSTEFFRQLYQDSGSVDLRILREPKDTPPPIVYDDEFGKAILAFQRVRSGRFIVPVFGAVYQEEGKDEVDLTGLMHRDFYFAWNDFGGFSTLSNLGDPVVFFNHRLLQMSRNYLLALAHEMGHTHQGDIERDMQQIIGTKGSEKLKQQLRKKYPTLEEYIEDLSLIADISITENQREKTRLANRVRNVGKNGFNTRFIDSNLPELVDQILKDFNSGDFPLGPSHQPGFFNSIKANLPALYDIFDPMGERIGWEFALDLDNSGIINAGFHTDEERTLFMFRGLQTYDTKYGVNNYTRWLTAA